MFLMLKKDGMIRDARESMRGVYIREGKHEVKRIPCPDGVDGSWLVLTGTEIGGPENRLNNPDTSEGKLINWGNMEAILTEDPPSNV